MKKYICILGLVLLACGCATVDDSYDQDVKIEGRRFISLRQVYPGMTRQEVSGVLGQQVIVGYEMQDEANGQYNPVTVKNPYREEDVTQGNKIYHVDYYFVGINKADGQITDDELAPLVFLNDQMTGMGWEYLNAKIKKAPQE